MSITIDRKRLKEVMGKPLLHGSHSPDGQMCVMEAVAYVAGEKWSDAPQCASPVITAFCVNWNDSMSDEDRQLLKPYIPKIVNTRASAEIERKRSWMALDWYCRVSAPTWLDLAGLKAEAKAIRATAPIVDAKSAKAAQVALDSARQAARAARDAAWAAAGDAAGDAAGAAAGAAAWAAAGDAAGAAAGAAAGDAAWAAAGAAAGDAAWAAAGAAAWAAAWAAARDAARAAAGDAAWAAVWAAAWAVAGAAAGDAAGDAAWAALRPTVVSLQKSALKLLSAMIAVTE